LTRGPPRPARSESNRAATTTTEIVVRYRPWRHRDRRAVRDRPRRDLNAVGHEVGPADQRAGKRVDRPIRIGDGTWIATRAVVLAGVTIGRGCVIAAGAVVTRDCEPHGLYAGAPAARRRDLPVGG